MPLYEELKDSGVFPIYVLIVGSVLTFLYKHFRDMESRNFKVTKGELDSLLEVFRDPKLMGVPFVLEQVIQLKLKVRVPYPAIKALLTFESPTRSMIDFANASRFIDIAPGRQAFYFKSVFATPRKRTWWNRASFVGYLLFAMSPTVWLSIEVGLLAKADPVQVLGLFTVTLPLIVVFILFAVMCLNFHVGVFCGERLMGEAARNGLAVPPPSVTEQLSAEVQKAAASGQGGRTQRKSRDSVRSRPSRAE